MKHVYTIPEKYLKKVKAEDGTEKEETQETFLTGTITCNVPGYTEAAKLLKDLRFKTDENGKLIPRPDDEQETYGLEIIPKYIEAVDAKSIDGKYEFKSFEDLAACAEGKLVVGKVTMIILGGFSLSKKS